MSRAAECEAFCWEPERSEGLREEGPPQVGWALNLRRAFDPSVVPFSGSIPSEGSPRQLGGVRRRWYVKTLSSSRLGRSPQGRACSFPDVQLAFRCSFVRVWGGVV